MVYSYLVLFSFEKQWAWNKVVNFKVFIKTNKKWLARTLNYPTTYHIVMFENFRLRKYVKKNFHFEKKNLNDEKQLSFEDTKS